ncbi:MAG: hypothetical protein ACI867_000607 [Glaciecola sp.]
MVGAHAVLGFICMGALLVLGFHARGKVRSGRPYEGAPYLIGVILIDLQVLLGIGLWVQGEWWLADGFLQPWLHPILSLGAFAAVHVGIRRANNERWAAQAYGIAGRAMFLPLILLLAVVGISEAA